MDAYIFLETMDLGEQVLLVSVLFLFLGLALSWASQVKEEEQRGQTLRQAVCKHFWTIDRHGMSCGTCGYRPKQG